MNAAYRCIMYIISIPCNLEQLSIYWENIIITNKHNGREPRICCALLFLNIKQLRNNDNQNKRVAKLRSRLFAKEKKQLATLLVMSFYILEDIARQMVALRLTEEHKDAYMHRTYASMYHLQIWQFAFSSLGARECPRILCRRGCGRGDKLWLDAKRQKPTSLILRLIYHLIGGSASNRLIRHTLMKAVQDCSSYSVVTILRHIFTSGSLRFPQ